jgi:hypothetical protein
MKSEARKLANYNRYLSGMQEIRRDKADMEPTDDYASFMHKGIIIIT